jgi:peptidoglycan/xylan/chitin deacetylase (PgdA/CDA1 family)
VCLSKLFEAQVSYLRQQGYYSVDLFRVVITKIDWETASGRPILITFDDGYRDFIDFAWPVLQRHGFSAMVLWSQIRLARLQIGISTLGIQRPF